MSGWAMGISAVAGLGSAYLGSKNKATAIPTDVYNAYGEKNTPNTGAITSRDNIFGRVNDQHFQSQATGFADQYRRALQGAAVDPRLGAVSDYGSAVLRGDYLQSPQVTNYANQAADGINAAGADNARRVGATFARGGQGFSTGMLQALQSARAAAAQKAATTRAGILMQGYQQERGLQQGASDIVSGAVAQPLNYLGQVNNAMYAPLQAQAGLTTQLLGSNQVREPTQVQEPTFADKLAGGVQTATGLYSLYKGLKPTPGAPAPTK